MRCLAKSVFDSAYSTVKGNQALHGWLIIAK